MIGAGVPAELLLARTDAAAVAVNGLLAYPSGFEFVLTAVLHQEDRYGRIFDLGFGHRSWRDGDEQVPPELLRLGVQFSDGSAATNLDWRLDFSSDAEAAPPVLTPDGGGGGGRRYEMRYWVWPLPPPGPVTFVCQWPVHGIAESRAVLQAQLIRDAAPRAVRLWPDD